MADHNGKGCARCSILRLFNLASDSSGYAASAFWGDNLLPLESQAVHATAGAFTGSSLRRLRAFGEAANHPQSRHALTAQTSGTIHSEKPKEGRNDAKGY
jgi:hypothetical protein